MEYVHRLLRRDPHLLLRLDTKVTGFEDAEVTIEIGDDNSDIKQFPFFVHRCSDIEQMTRLGESIGISKLIHECCIQIKVSSGTMDPNNFLRSLDNAPSYQRLQSIYRGIESNTSIKTLTLDLESIGIPRNESFALLNFQNAQFISNLNEYSDGTSTRGDDQVECFEHSVFSNSCIVISNNHFCMPAVSRKASHIM